MNETFHLQPPIPPQHWEGVKDAVQLAPVCPQDSLSSRTENHLQDEDCLYLNIFAPFEVS